ARRPRHTCPPGTGSPHRGGETPRPPQLVLALPRGGLRATRGCPPRRHRPGPRAPRQGYPRSPPIPRVGIDATPRQGQQTQPSLVGLTLAERLDQPEQILFDRKPIGSRGKSGKLGQSHLDELEVLARKVEMGSRYRRLGFLEFLLVDQDGNPHVQDLSFRRRRVGSRRRVELGSRLVQPAATEE